jgi:hypothetical protein
MTAVFPALGATQSLDGMVDEVVRKGFDSWLPAH